MTSDPLDARFGPHDCPIGVGFGRIKSCRYREGVWQLGHAVMPSRYPVRAVQKGELRDTQAGYPRVFVLEAIAPVEVDLPDLFGKGHVRDDLFGQRMRSVM